MEILNFNAADGVILEITVYIPPNEMESPGLALVDANAMVEEFAEINGYKLMDDTVFNVKETK